MGTLLSAFAIVFVALSAQAATYSTKDNKGDCPPSIAHKPDPSIEYKSGVGKDGWAVTPADIAPSPFPEGTFDEIPIGFNIPIGVYASGVGGVDLSETHMGIGQFTVKKDGSLDFNGQKFESQSYSSAGDCE